MSRPLVVVGDALLDVDLVGTASRLTPDAPVPVVEDVSRRERPGGAALAAVIAAATTNREVVLVAPFDSDEAAARLRALLDGRVRVVEIPATGSPSVDHADAPPRATNAEAAATAPATASPVTAPSASSAAAAAANESPAPHGSPPVTGTAGTTIGAPSP